jgi:hypothetical protein
MTSPKVLFEVSVGDVHNVEGLKKMFPSDRYYLRVTCSESNTKEIYFDNLKYIRDAIERIEICEKSDYNSWKELLKALQVSGPANSLITTWMPTVSMR